VATVDVVSEKLGVKLLSLGVITGESLLRVGNVDTTVRGTLERTKDSGTGGGALETNVEEALERSRLIVTKRLSFGEFTIGLGNTLILVSKTEDGKSSSGHKQTSGICGGPVGQTGLDTVSGELLGGSLGENVVALDPGVNDLARDVSVGESYYQAVLGSIVFVLGLGNETLSGARLDSLNERLWRSIRCSPGHITTQHCQQQVCATGIEVAVVAYAG
jgi:hypothetical protein